MKITYDHEVDALYIRFKETTVKPSIWLRVLPQTTMLMVISRHRDSRCHETCWDSTVFKQIILEDIALGKVSIRRTSIHSQNRGRPHDCTVYGDL